jgi:hypothetical protein
MAKVKIEPERDPPFHEKRDLEEKLNEPSCKDSNGQGQDWWLEMIIKEEDGRDDGNIQKDRSYRGRKKMAEGI